MSNFREATSAERLQEAVAGLAKAVGSLDAYDTAIVVGSLHANSEGFPERFDPVWEALGLVVQRVRVFSETA